MTLNYDFIKEQFKLVNYILLSKEYINHKTKLDYTCPNGHTHSMTWKHFKKGVRCGRCFGNKLITYDYVKSVFESKNCTLLTTIYINSTTKLDYICANGHPHSISWQSFNAGHSCLICDNNRKRGGDTHPSWKGGVTKNNLPLYTTYASKLVAYQPVYLINHSNLDLLGVECMYCGKIFIPNTSNVISKINSINGKGKGEANLYCSSNCKKACPTYGQIKYPKGFKLITSREVQPALRKLVLARDNYQCQICEAGLEETELHCHHIEAVSQNPIESADIDNCITLCKKHHKQVHTLPDCGYNELRCNN